MVYSRDRLQQEVSHLTKMHIVFVIVCEIILLSYKKEMQAFAFLFKLFPLLNVFGTNKNRIEDIGKL